MLLILSSSTTMIPRYSRMLASCIRSLMIWLRKSKDSDFMGYSSTNSPAAANFFNSRILLSLLFFGDIDCRSDNLTSTIKGFYGATKWLSSTSPSFNSPFPHTMPFYKIFVFVLLVLLVKSQMIFFQITIEVGVIDFVMKSPSTKV